MQLGECHGHIILDGVYFKDAIKKHEIIPDDTIIRACFQQYQERQITFFRDGGDNKGVSARAAELALEYDIDYRSPIFAIYKKNQYGSMVGNSFETMNEYVQLVKEVKRKQGDFIKVMFTGILDFNAYGVITSESLMEKEMREITHIAHEEGFSVMAHVNGSDAIRRAIDAGVDSIEHGYYLELAGRKELADTDIVWVPTCSPIGNAIGTNRFSDDVLQNILEEQMKSIKSAMELGVHIAIGSDAGAYQVLHGEGVEKEYQYVKTACKKEDNELFEYLQKSEQRIKEKFKRD